MKRLALKQNVTTVETVLRMILMWHLEEDANVIGACLVEGLNNTI